MYRKLKKFHSFKINKTNKTYKYIDILIYLIKIKLFILFFILQILKKSSLIPNYNIEYNNNYFKIPNYLNLGFNGKIKNKIRIGICTGYLSNGGRARITAILINYLIRIKLFDIYLFTRGKKLKNDYRISNLTKRIIINNNLLKLILKNKIQILIYELTNTIEIKKLNNFKNLKVIFYHHSSVFGWIYFSFNYFKIIYELFKESKYVITLVPLENDYLFKKWGIKSILMNNFMTYDFNSIVPSDLSSKIILMIGRAFDKKKRFELGIKAMKYIEKQIPEAELKIISSIKGITYLKKLINYLNLNDKIKFIGYLKKPEIYFKNASLHFFPTLFESFGLVLSETKLYGIPSILMGVDYVSISKGGTIILYDDKPESLAKETIKILNNKKYRKKLGKEARKSIKKFNNEKTFIKWVKLILSVYNGDKYYEILRKRDKIITEKESKEILNAQIKLLKKRLPKRFKNITLRNFENFTFLKNLK